MLNDRSYLEVVFVEKSGFIWLIGTFFGLGSVFLIDLGSKPSYTIRLANVRDWPSHKPNQFHKVESIAYEYRRGIVDIV